MKSMELLANKKNVPALFSSLAARNSEAPALKLHDRHISYGQLDELSGKIASHLRDAGVGRETLVGICMPRSFEMVIGMLAIMKAGAAYVPIDPAYPQTRINYILNDANLPFVLSHSHIECSEARLRCTWLNVNDWLDRGNQLQPSGSANTVFASDYASIGSDDLAYVIYTSGSTGNPKGVMIEHRAAINLLLGLLNRTEIHSARRWLGIAPIVFDASVGDWMACLVSGGCYVIPDDDQVNDPFVLGRMINECDINVVVATPSRWRQIIGAGWEGKKDLVAMCGGEALTPALLKDLSKRCRTLWNCYGPTEATVWSLVREVNGKVDDEPLILANSLPNYEHLVVDQNNRPVMYREVGELCISGPGLARGYLNRPDLTTEKFIDFHAPELPLRRIYKTGDLVKQIGEDQYLYVGRLDDQVKVRGFRVELGEIENRLRTISDIEDAVVLYVPLNETSDHRVLVAYLEVSGADKTDIDSGISIRPDREEQHRQQLGELLPDYMIPVIFIYLDSFPVTSNGKVDKKSLPMPAEVVHAKPDEKAETPAEKELAIIWSNIFADPHIGINDNFFALGGNSLLAVTLVNEIRRHCDFPIFRLDDVAEFPTVRTQGMLLSVYRSRKAAAEQGKSSQYNINEREVFTL